MNTAGLCQTLNRLRSLSRQFLMSSTNPSPGVKRSFSAGIIIIGDEILKGQVQDSNSFFLSKSLFDIGVSLKKVSVIGDDVDEIASEVFQFSQKYTYVFTAGGIGPTHDDITFEGVAKAFRENLYFHPKLLEICQKYFGTDDPTNPKVKPAKVPQSTVLHFGLNKKTGEKGRFPVVQVKNVFVFPGVPQLIRLGFSAIEDMVRNPDHHRFVRELYLRQDEASVTHILNQVVGKFKDKVTMGSYPELQNSYYKVRWTLQSDNSEVLEEACGFIKEALPSDCLINYDPAPIIDASTKVYSVQEPKSLATKLQSALAAIEEGLKTYKREEIYVGFNGGKDCTALLHLTHAVYQKLYPGEPTRLRVLYIRRGETFPELEVFIQRCVKNYQLELLTVEGRIKEALITLQQTHPGVKAVVMGTRHSDPHCAHLTSFAPTDPGWPSFMRVNPILDWTFSDVWTFLRYFSLDYCTLYDHGFTSIGSMDTTHPNPALQYVDPVGAIRFRPAYMLSEASSERCGRQDGHHKANTSCQTQDG